MYRKSHCTSSAVGIIPKSRRQKFPSANFQTMSSPSDIILRIQRLEGKECRSLEIALTKKQTTKFSSANYKKMLSPSDIILRIQRLEGKLCRSR